MRKRKIHLSVLFAAVVAGLQAGCGSSTSEDSIARSSEGSPISVVCTTNVIKDLVQQIGGNRVVVSAIMDGPGIDPHTYTPSPRDTNLLTAAELVVYSGLHLEGQFDGALDSLNNRGIPVICVTDVLARDVPDRLIKSETGVPDPHVWFDPQLWAACGSYLAEQLTEIDPAGRDHYATAAAAFSKQMLEVQAEAGQLLESIPEDQRVLVTAHDAFEYFARVFRFKVEAVQGISTESEPGLRRVNDLIALLAGKKISAVFAEQSVSDKNISALIEGCQSRGHVLRIGGRLYSDTVGAEGTAEGTLSGALLHNVREIANALGAVEEPAR